MPRPSRRNLMLAAPLLGVGGAWAQEAGPGQARDGPVGAVADWAWLRGRFLAAEGQMIPARRPTATLSLFQAIGLLAALRADDRPGFERILEWSLSVLRRPDDSLWVWRLDEGRDPHLPDINNSTHADVLAAWALVQAGEQWRRADLRQIGVGMARDVLARCLLPGEGPPLLMPAAGGFFNARRGVLSPGGLVLPALPDLARAAPDRRWPGVQAEALSLIRRARFGPWLLPADWVEHDRATGRLSLAPTWPPRFSAIAANAVLHLCWAGLGQEPVVNASLAFWEGAGRALPAWTDLRSGNVAAEEGHSGLHAVARLAQAARLGRGTMDILPAIANAEDEEAAGTLMLCRMAWRDIGLSRRGE